MKSFTLILTALIVFLVVSISSYFISKPNTYYHKVSYQTLSKETKKQIDCLADNIYFESAHEPKEGKIAVAFVTLNRTENPHFPSSVCEVVKQKTKSTCQFSWWCEAKPKSIALSKDLTKRNDKLYNEIVDLAIYVYMNKDSIVDPSKGALFYHADYVNPKWDGVKMTKVIGRHIFYRKEKIQ